MYAIVEIAGHQYKVEQDQKLYVNRLEAKVGEAVRFDRVLLTADGDRISLGAPAIEGASVAAKVLEHLKADKKIIFKKKRRKGYQKKNGHRQALTQIQISALEAAAPKQTSASQKTTAKKAADKTPSSTGDAKAKADDLKKIEGVEPKIAQLLAEAQIDTFAELAQTEVARLKEILA